MQIWEMHNFELLSSNRIFSLILDLQHAQAYSLKIYVQWCDLGNTFHEDCGMLDYSSDKFMKEMKRKVVSNSTILLLDTFQYIALQSLLHVLLKEKAIQLEKYGMHWLMLKEIPPGFPQKGNC